MEIILDKYNIFKDIKLETRVRTKEYLQITIQQHIEDVTNHVLGRAKHRKTVVGKYEKDLIVCPKCKENWTRSFVRNGYSKRQLCTLSGMIFLQLPIIKCKKCGKKFRSDSYLVPRNVHTWYDVHSFCVEMYGSRCSFGMIQRFLYRCAAEWLGKYTLMNIVRRLPVLEKKGPCPSEIGIDALWVRHGLQENNAVVLVATDTVKRKMMDFMWAESENERDIQRFVERLEKNFNLNPKTLENLVSDGQKAIIKVTEGLSQYRTICLFHILQNIQQNARDKLLGRKMVKDASKILKLKRYVAIQRRLQKFINKWSSKEPKAIGNFLYSINDQQKILELPKGYSRTNNVAENIIRQIRRKSKQMDNFRTEETTNVCLEMIHAQIGQFKTLGDWFSPLEQRLVCA